jgi:hypothetical protein
VDGKALLEPEEGSSEKVNKGKNCRNKTLKKQRPFF